MNFDQMPRLLWITPKWPLPAHDGARMATTHLLQQLSRFGVKIDLLALADPDENFDLEEARSTLGVQTSKVILREKYKDRLRKYLGMARRFALSPHQAITIAPFATKQIRKDVSHYWTTYQEKHPRATVVFDGLHTAAAFAPTNASLPAMVYRAHNVESNLWVQKAQRSSFFLKKFFFNFQASRVHKFEDRIVKTTQAIATVSQEDLNQFKKLYSFKAGESIPIGLQSENPLSAPPFDQLPRNLLFLGRLDWPPNKEGLKWLIDEVWPNVSKVRTDLHLIIAGKGDATWLIPKIDGNPTISFLGEVSDLKEVYSKCHLSLVPIFFGSGTRVKVIEASLLAKPCLSTAIGVEGTGLEANRSYLSAETKEEWIRALTNLDVNQLTYIGQEAYFKLRLQFDPRLCAEKFANLVNQAFAETPQ